jgi:hypothetical protein
MRIACWIPRATNTHSEYVILIVFTLQEWLHERASMLRYTYTACRVANQYNLIQDVDVGKWYSHIGIWDNFQNRILSPTAQAKSSREESERERGGRHFRIFPPLVNHGLVFCQQTESYAPFYLLWLYYSLPQYRQTHAEDIRNSTDDCLVHLEVSACILTS